MIVKQIDMQTALKLAAAGKEIKLLYPPGPDSSWTDMMPATLQSMLEGCLFFRLEPAMINQDFEEAVQEMEENPPEPIIEDTPQNSEADRPDPPAAKAKRGGGSAPHRKRPTPAKYTPCITRDGVRPRSLMK